MRLIKEIEVKYFRSIYTQKIEKLSDLTVFFGRNDAGKSNYLRALNLFFNDETNPGEVFDFDRDFNKARRGEADTVKKFVYVKVTFRTPSSFPSLGEEFWVKKTWIKSRGEKPEETFGPRAKSDTKTQRVITKFLKKIRLHYIPAIKDRKIFENLLEQVYEVIAVDADFNKSLKQFTKALQKKTQDISKSLMEQMDIESVIAPPENLKDLFRSLDFETKNATGDTHSLTLQKGDGVQMRHIPIILAFLSDKGSHEYNIWGFEEPENSLELAMAVNEANSFIRHSQSTNKQIFITSHSPAFFSIKSEACNRYFISKQIITGLKKQTSRADLIKPGDRPSQLMGETPLLPMISEYLTEAQKEIEEHKGRINEIQQQLDESSDPALFVEGLSDKIILDRCWELFGHPEMNLSIFSCSGTSKMKSLAKDGDVFKTLNPGKHLFVLIDNDKEGRGLYPNGNLAKNGGGNWVMHKSNDVYWCRLKFSDEFSATMKKLGVPIDFWPYTLENCFSNNIHRKAIEEEALLFESSPHDELLSDGKCKKIIFSLIKEFDKHYYLLAPHKDYKIPFAEWIVDQSKYDPAILESFQPIMEGLKLILSENRN